MPTSTSRVLALPLIEAVAEHYPDVLLEIIEGSSADLAVAVSLHRMDIAVAMDVQPQPSRMTTTPLLMESLYLVGPDLGVEAITLQQMAGLPLVLPSFPNSVRVLAARAFAEQALSVNLIAETSAVSVLLALARAGRGWTVLPASAAVGPEADADQVVFTPIADQSFNRRVSVCMSLSAEKSSVCTHIHRMLIEVARNLVQTERWAGVAWLADVSHRAVRM